VLRLGIAYGNGVHVLAGYRWALPRISSIFIIMQRMEHITTQKEQ